MKKDPRIFIHHILASSTSISLWYAKLSRKRLRSLGDKAFSLSSVDTRDTPEDLIGTTGPSYVSEHTIAKHLCQSAMFDAMFNAFISNMSTCRHNNITYLYRL